MPQIAPCREPGGNYSSLVRAPRPGTHTYHQPKPTQKEGGEGGWGGGWVQGSEKNLKKNCSSANWKIWSGTDHTYLLIFLYSYFVIFLYSYFDILLYSYFDIFLGWKIDERILNILAVTLPPLEKLTTIE